MRGRHGGSPGSRGFLPPSLSRQGTPSIAIQRPLHNRHGGFRRAFFVEEFPPLCGALSPTMSASSPGRTESGPGLHACLLCVYGGCRVRAGQAVRMARVRFGQLWFCSSPSPEGKIRARLNLLLVIRAIRGGYTGDVYDGSRPLVTASCAVSDLWTCIQCCLCGLTTARHILR